MDFLLALGGLGAMGPEQLFRGEGVEAIDLHLYGSMALVTLEPRKTQMAPKDQIFGQNQSGKWGVCCAGQHLGAAVLFDAADLLAMGQTQAGGVMGC